MNYFLSFISLKFFVFFDFFSSHLSPHAATTAVIARTYWRVLIKTEIGLKKRFAKIYIKPSRRSYHSCGIIERYLSAMHTFVFLLILTHPVGGNRFILFRYFSRHSDRQS